jgi:ADP-ribose pyrophosphatase
MTMATKPLGEQLGWKLIRTSYVYKSRWFNLRKDHIFRVGKGEGVYSYIEHPGSVFVVPLTAQKRIILIRSYRYTLDSWCWEVPAGTLGGHGDRAPEAVALQELEEEVGATCRSLKPLGSYYLGNGFANHTAHFFLAFDVQKSSDMKLDAFEEIIETATFSFEEVRDLLKRGTIDDGESAFALLLVLNSL